MRKYVFLLSALLFTGWLSAQEPEGEFQRSPQMMAKKQTSMMVRELGIKDSIQQQRIYEFHLKYALSRPDSISRRENLRRMEQMSEELKTVLTEEQYERFMNRQMDVSKHRMPSAEGMTPPNDRNAPRPSEPHRGPRPAGPRE